MKRIQPNAPNPFNNDGMDISSTNHNEIKVAKKRLKTNKASDYFGLTEGLFKSGKQDPVFSVLF